MTTAQLEDFDVNARAAQLNRIALAIADSLDQASADVEAFATENCPDLPADLFDNG